MISKKVELKISNIKDIKKVLKANIPLFIIIGFLIFVTYINGINGEFISDDIPGIIKNPRVVNFDQAIKGGYLQEIVQSTLYNAFGGAPQAFHGFSMIFHFVNVILFFVIIYNLFNKQTAALTSVLYAIHPVTAETVLWMSAVNYLINTFFIYTSIIAYLVYRKTDNKKVLLGILVPFAVLPFTFPNVWLFLLPFLLVAIEIFFLGLFKKKSPLRWKPILHLIPFFAAIAAHFAIRIQSSLIERVGSLATPDATPYFNRLPFTFYLPWELFIWPKELTIYHEGQIIGTFKFWLMIVVALTTVIGTLVMLKKPKLQKYGIIITLIFLSTLPTFSPVQVAWFVAERYLYISVGFYCLLVTTILLDIEKKKHIKNFALIIVSILLIAYSIRGIVRTNDWKTRKSLWLATEKIGFYSARVHNNLGDVYGLEKNWSESVRHFELAIKIKPNYSAAIHNLGNVYMQMGNLDAAEQVLKRSLEIDPLLFNSVHKLGLIEYNRQNIDAARDYFYKTLEINPNYLPAIEALQILDQRNL